MPTTQRRDTATSVYTVAEVPTTPELRDDPYVKLLRHHLEDADLFRGDPRRTRRRRQELLVPYLDFFLRHDRGGFYRDLFKQAGLLNRHRNAVRDRASLEDLYALRIASDELRGDGQERRLTAPAAVERRRVEERRVGGGPQRSAGDDGKIFSSTGTSINPDGPVRVYRSSLTLELARRMNAQLIDWAMGTKLVEGSALLYMAERMAERSWFAHLGRDVLEYRGVPLRFGAHLKGLPFLSGSDPVDKDSAETVWRRLRPDLSAIRDFVADERRPKYLVGTTSSLHDLLVRNGVGRRALLNVVAGVPPLHLGRRGVMVVGGGTKDALMESGGDASRDGSGDDRARSEGGPEARNARDLIREIAQYVTTDTGKGRVPAPVIDVLGLTESVSTFVGKTTSPLSPRAWVHYPHPLTYVSFLEGAGEPRPVAVNRHDRGDRERRLFFVNFACLDYLEAIVPGDVVAPVYRDDGHQHGFVFRHRH